MRRKTTCTHHPCRRLLAVDYNFSALGPVAGGVQLAAEIIGRDIDLGEIPPEASARPRPHSRSRDLHPVCRLDVGRALD